MPFALCESAARKGQAIIKIIAGAEGFSENTAGCGGGETRNSSIRRTIASYNWLWKRKKGRHNMPEPIELHIRGGGLVIALDPAQDPAIYMMNPKPEVLFWGERTFYRLLDARYEEACVMSVLTQA